MSTFIQKLNDNLESYFNRLLEIYLVQNKFDGRDNYIYKTIYDLDNTFLTLLKDFILDKAKNENDKYYVKYNENDSSAVVKRLQVIKALGSEGNLEDDDNIYDGKEVCTEIAFYIDYILKCRASTDKFQDKEFKFNFDLSFMFMDALESALFSLITLDSTEYNFSAKIYSEDELVKGILSKLPINDLKSLSIYFGMRLEQEEDNEIKILLERSKDLVDKEIKSRYKKPDDGPKRGSRFPRITSIK